MSTKRFLGYDTDEKSKLVINKEQALIIERIYDEFLSGKTVDCIKRILEKEGVKNWNGKAMWQSTTISSILGNEKYKGDAILQKSYTVDFLSKKRTKNEGHIQQYHMEENHEAIIDPLIWEAVQLEQKRRSQYIKEHGTNSYSHKPETNPFAGKVICGTCNKALTRKGWKTKNGYRKVWQCQDRYYAKGVQGCTNRHVDEAVLKEVFILSWNRLLDNQEELKKKWEISVEFGDPLEQYRAVQFADMSENGEHIKDVDTDFILRTLNHIKVFETGKIVIQFMDKSEITCEGE
jgi:23S rRNA maturation mini-RNase III